MSQYFVILCHFLCDFTKTVSFSISNRPQKALKIVKCVEENRPIIFFSKIVYKKKECKLFFYVLPVL